MRGDAAQRADPIAVRASRRLISEEGLITDYSGVRLRMDLDRVPLWSPDADHVALAQLWDNYAKYLYLPRLRNSAARVEAVRNGISALTWESDIFAYAAAYDEATKRYRGLVAGQQAEVVLDSSALGRAARCRACSSTLSPDPGADRALGQVLVLVRDQDPGRTARIRSASTAEPRSSRYDCCATSARSRRR